VKGIRRAATESFLTELFLSHDYQVEELEDKWKPDAIDCIERVLYFNFFFETTSLKMSPSIFRVRHSLKLSKRKCQKKCQNVKIYTALPAEPL